MLVRLKALAELVDASLVDISPSAYTSHQRQQQDAHRQTQHVPLRCQMASILAAAWSAASALSKQVTQLTSLPLRCGKTARYTRMTTKAHLPAAGAGAAVGACSLTAAGLLQVVLHCCLHLFAEVLPAAVPGRPLRCLHHQSWSVLNRWSMRSLAVWPAGCR